MEGNVKKVLVCAACKADWTAPGNPGDCKTCGKTSYAMVEGRKPIEVAAVSCETCGNRKDDSCCYRAGRSSDSYVKVDSSDKCDNWFRKE